MYFLDRGCIRTLRLLYGYATGGASLLRTSSGRTPKSRIAKFGLEKQETYRSIVWCQAYFDILNRLVVSRECDTIFDTKERQTYGQTFR